MKLAAYKGKGCSTSELIQPFVKGTDFLQMHVDAGPFRWLIVSAAFVLRTRLVCPELVWRRGIRDIRFAVWKCLFIYMYEPNHLSSIIEHADRMWNECLTMQNKMVLVVGISRLISVLEVQLNTNTKRNWEGFGMLEQPNATLTAFEQIFASLDYPLQTWKVDGEYLQE